MISIPKSFRIAALSALAASAIVAGPAFVASPARAEDAVLSPALKSLQGDWTSREDAEIQADWTIKDDTIKVTVNGTEYAGKVVVDDAAKPHPALTIEIKEGPGDAAGQSAKGVYKLDGEKLLVNIGAPGQDRPTDLNPGGTDVYLFSLTKKKAAK
ncbi:hypothetical protein [Paludisphaera mucosa]|uniref:TIGR03067 domain-containing protein n=1 Tax=Paludisphaera mucosa TaxID=3030827 RepID=A0ABT6FGY3_9BACT|nr:hypothetical protein [Paludisphaera mucosa]MDG3006764.1 hypothetical protein [Paludisphaera mucosa]